METCWGASFFCVLGREWQQSGQRNCYKEYLNMLWRDTAVFWYNKSRKKRRNRLMDYGYLMEEAMKARKMAYAPYSQFQVGAALLCTDGSVYTGCNVENASYGAANCAERTAFFKAVSEGKRSFRAIAVAGGKKDTVDLEPCPPCGICRQVMEEFCSPDFVIVLGKNEADYQLYTLREIFPLPFGE